MGKNLSEKENKGKISDFSEYTTHHEEVYGTAEVTQFPLKSVYHALAVYREGSPVGRIRSVEITPDKIQVSQVTDEVILAERFLSDAVKIQILNKHHLYNSVVLALNRILRAAHPIHKAAFEMRYIGSKYRNDTGDIHVLSIIEIANRFSRERSAVEKWIRKLREDFERELISRGLLRPEAKEVN